MIIVKTKLSKCFDIVESEEDFRNKFIEIIGISLYRQKEEMIKSAIKNGDIKRRNISLNIDENGVNYCSVTVTVFKNFDTYEAIRLNPINSEIHRKLFDNKFELSSEIKYFSEII
jgi:hypothetical protein